MKTLKSLCLSLLFVTEAIFSARGEQFRTDINPAQLYYQAFLLAPDLEHADHEYLFTSQWWGQKLPERFGELVARYNGQFRLVRQAAHATSPCDWGIDRSAGPATLLPQLPRAKAIAQTARLRAMWDLQQGRPTDACDDLLATLALGRNLSRGGTFISVLIQLAIENIVASTVAENFYQFSPETLKQLVEGFDAAPARGTLAACVPTEKSFFQDWLLRKILELQKENPGNDAKVMEDLHQLFRSFEDPQRGETDFWERLSQAAGSTSDGVIKLIHDYEQVYQRIAVLLALPYREYESQVKEFSVEVQKSPNPFISARFAGLLKFPAREFTILVDLAMVRAAVEYKLHGEAGLKSVMDPCGKGPFAFQRFVFEGVDRGFQLKSAYGGGEFTEVLIFVEKEGTPFRVAGPQVGQALENVSQAEAFRRRYGIAPGK